MHQFTAGLFADLSTNVIYDFVIDESCTHRHTLWVIVSMLIFTTSLTIVRLSNIVIEILNAIFRFVSNWNLNIFTSNWN